MVLTATGESRISRSVLVLFRGVSGARQMMSDAERAVDALLEDAQLAAPYQIAGLVARHAATLRADDALVYLVDPQQRILVPFLDFAPLPIDSCRRARKTPHRLTVAAGRS
jgi:hypothetical protein